MQQHTKIFNERILSDKELDIFNKEFQKVSKRVKFLVKYFTGYTILVFVVSICAYFNIPSSDIIVLFFTTIGFLIAGVWGFLELYLKEKKRLKNIVYVKDKNYVLSINVVSDDYIQIPETEDEGDYYLFQLGHDKIVYIGGQDFYESETFPNNNFEIVIAKGPKNEIVFLEKYDKGRKINPKQKLLKSQRVNLTDEQIQEIQNQDSLTREIVTILSGQIDKISIVNKSA